MKVIKHEKKPKIKNAYLIEGLPGIGNVARICADYLIDKLDAKKVLSLYSESLPNYVFIDENNEAEMPCLDFYHAKQAGEHLVFVVGDIQPMEEEKSHALAQEILDASESLNVDKVITLGGIGLKKKKKKSRVHAATTDQSFNKKLSSCGAVFEGNKTVSVIVGAAGTLLGWGKVRGMRGFSLLSETLVTPGHVGIKSAKQILKVLMKYFGLDISLEGLDKEIKELEKFNKEKMKRIKKELPKKDLHYIG